MIKEHGRVILCVDGEQLVIMSMDLELGLKQKIVCEVDHAFIAPFMAPAAVSGC